MGVSTMPAQSTQNAKFATSQQYIRKEVRDKFDFFWMKVNMELFSMLKVPKITIFQNHCNLSRKRGGMKLIFWMQINIKLFYKLMLSTLVDKASQAQSILYRKFAKS